MENDNNTKKTYGLLGRNISYSLSPPMHNAAFRHFGIPAEYELFDIEENKLEEFLKEDVLSGKVSGFNITVPYKIKVHDILKARTGSTLQAVTSLLGTVNTVKVDGGKLTGYNTDCEGFYASLIEDTGFNPKGKNIFLLGAGGAGRAIAFYLAYLGADRGEGPNRICVFDADVNRSSSLVDDCNDYSKTNICFLVDEASISTQLAGSSLFINATPIGTKEGEAPIDTDLLHEEIVVYDLVYCRETELVKAAREKGIVAAGGLGMLIGQAALSFNIWTGKPLDETKKVMQDALKEKGY